MNKQNIKIVEEFLSAMKEKDLSRAPLADDMIFENPIAGKGAGAENFRAFMSGFLPAINDIKIISHVSEGDTIAARWEADSVFGIIQIGEFIRIRDGKIIETASYFDPRPIIS